MAGGAEDVRLWDNRGANWALGGAGWDGGGSGEKWRRGFGGSLIWALWVHGPVLHHGKVPKPQR